ncbi:MAG: 4-hydroxy-3-methylbut-2-enyl diphosphate reductase [Bacteroidales bacterium]|nr:4-hydroxy-3-methylbut-2-enyl diphosphate reductase [Bacteroidales bacterium]
MKINIDPYSGFCFGVKKAIEIAENELKQNKTLYSLGDIVHNREEIARLDHLGLKTIDYKRYKKSANTKVLIRAHGEPPPTYEYAKKNNIEILEGTCSIVLRLQQRVRKAYMKMNQVGGQVVIFGKKTHPEIIGLAGHTENTSIIIESLNDLEKLDYLKPIRLFVQTTKSKEDYLTIVGEIKYRIKKAGVKQSNLIYYNSICGQVSNRVPKLKEFCIQNDVVIFVSGKKSSNGKYLYGVCKSVNPKSFFISSHDELEPEWFSKAKTVGISGATSTPKWLMEKVAREIEVIGNQ